MGILTRAVVWRWLARWLMRGSPAAVVICLHILFTRTRFGMALSPQAQEAGGPRAREDRSGVRGAGARSHRTRPASDAGTAIDREGYRGNGGPGGSPDVLIDT